LKHSIDRVNVRKGQWSAAEDSQLKHAVQKHADKDWGAIAALVPDRTQKQCWDRWKYKDPNRRTDKNKEPGTIKKAPALGLDRRYP
jgi:hypothetical protein